MNKKSPRSNGINGNHSPNEPQVISIFPYCVQKENQNAKVKQRIYIQSATPHHIVNGRRRDSHARSPSPKWWFLIQFVFHSFISCFWPPEIIMFHQAEPYFIRLLNNYRNGRVFRRGGGGGTYFKFAFCMREQLCAHDGKNIDNSPPSRIDRGRAGEAGRLCGPQTIRSHERSIREPLHVNYVRQIKPHINYRFSLWGVRVGYLENVNNNVLMSSRWVSGELYILVM